ncbi:wiskott-Aldrich syndrome protein family member 2-like, partial [Amphibalanus amphitrite]|uniref:wiskott-Aldrich syndrome protein family member 2-like n=1 Tax=Amphibalanus amphitrite TaxID=1232801 RepID=UPI001C919A77
MAAGRSDMRPERLAGEDENLTIWSDTETALFLKIWRRPDVQTALRQYTRKRPIWKKVSSELAAEGYRRSAEQCKSKMHNLMTSYRRVKKGVDPESRCKFFAVIDQVMMSPEFELQAGASGGPDGMDLDGGSSEESGPSTSALSDSAAMYPHSHSVSPGGRDDASAAAGDLDRCRAGPWRPVPLRPAEQPLYPGPGPGPGHGAGRAPAPAPAPAVPAVPAVPLPALREDDGDQPPRKRYCNWEERYEAEVAARAGRMDDEGPGAELKRPEMPMMAPMGGPERPMRPESPDAHEDCSGARDLRVPSRSPPERRGPVADEPPRGYSTMEARDLITARARQLLSVLPGHPALQQERDDGPTANGQHRA